MINAEVEEGGGEEFKENERDQMINAEIEGDGEEWRENGRDQMINAYGRQRKVERSLKGMRERLIDKYEEV